MASDSTHGILLGRLNSMGVSGRVLDWFSYYLSERAFSVASGPYSSGSVPLSFGVPQGSVLGPLLFALNMLSLGQIIQIYKGVSYHMYADHLQLYYCFSPGESLYMLLDCLEVIRTWLANNSFQLNSDKTKVLVVTSDNNNENLVSVSVP